MVTPSVLPIAVVITAAVPSMKINETIVTGKAPAVNRADMPAFDPRQAAAAAHMPTESAASVMFAAGSGPAKIKQEDAHQAPNKKLLRAPFLRKPPFSSASFGTDDIATAPFHWKNEKYRIGSHHTKASHHIVNCAKISVTAVLLIAVIRARGFITEAS